MPTCGTFVAAAILRGELDQVPFDPGYIVIHFQELYSLSAPSQAEPVSIYQRLLTYLRTQTQPIQSILECRRHVYSPVPCNQPESWPTKRFRPQIEKPRSHYLVVPVFYLLGAVDDPVKLLSLFGSNDLFRQWIHIVPYDYPQKLDQDRQLTIVEYNQNIFYAVANLFIPNLFEAMLTTWPTLISKPLRFEWYRDYADSLPVVLYGILFLHDFLHIAIRHGLDMNISPNCHVLDRIYELVKCRRHVTFGADIDSFILLITYGLSDFECGHGTPMEFILHFVKDVENYQWEDSSVNHAVALLESVGYQHTLGKNPIPIEREMHLKMVKERRTPRTFYEGTSVQNVEQAAHFDRDFKK